MKYAATLLMLLLAWTVDAQHYTVLSVIGRVEQYKDGTWRALSRREILSGDDRVRVGERSALNLLDQAGKRGYSFGETEPQRVDELISSTPKSTLGKFFAYFRQALMRGDTDRTSDDATVVYRDTGCDAAVCAALADAGYKSAYALSLCLVDARSGSEIAQSAAVDQDFYFRVGNFGPEPLFVNVLAVDADGNTEVCMPVDSGFTLSHLLIPAGATVDLADFQLTFCYPRGGQRFILVACDEPFDLRNAVRMRAAGAVSEVRDASRVGLFTKTVIIK